MKGNCEGTKGKEKKNGELKAYKKKRSEGETEKDEGEDGWKR